MNSSKPTNPDFEHANKMPYLTQISTGTDDADTTDERTKVLPHGNKTGDEKYESFCNCNEDQTANESSDTKIFNKMPSYFMQMDENSVIFQQQYECSVKESRNESKPKYTKSSGKILKKISQSEQNAVDNKKKQLMYSSQIYILKQQEPKEKNAYIWDRFLCLGDMKICIHQITKLKCLLDKVSPSERKLKIIQNENQELYFAASTALSANSTSMFCDHYLWFSKLIVNKMQSIRYLLKQFSNKPPFEISPPQLPLTTYLAKGLIYKKSQHLLNWQPRFIIITEKQLLSYKEINKDPTFTIRSETMKYIWTRFDLHHGHLIIKIKHGICKTEFAIPIADFCGAGDNNWLYGFYRMLTHGK